MTELLTNEYQKDLSGSHEDVKSRERALRVAKAAEALGTHSVRVIANEGDPYTVPDNGHTYQLGEGDVAVSITGPDTGELYKLAHQIERHDRRHPKAS